MEDEHEPPVTRVVASSAVAVFLAMCLPHLLWLSDFAWKSQCSSCSLNLFVSLRALNLESLMAWPLF